MGMRIRSGLSGLGLVALLGAASCGARPAPAAVAKTAPAAPTAATEPTLLLTLSRSPDTIAWLRRVAGCDDMLAGTDRAQSRWGDQVRDPLWAVCSTWRHVLAMQADARKGRDLVRLQCSAARLAELEPVLDRALALGASTPSPAIVSEARGRIVALDELAARSYAIDAAAEACVGEDAESVGVISR